MHLALPWVKFFYEDVLERLSGCHVCVWHHCGFTRLSESSNGDPDTPCSKPTKIFHFLPDVSVVSDSSSSSSLPYINTQIYNPSRSFRNGERLPSNWIFGNVLRQNHPACFDTTLCVRDQVLSPYYGLGYSLPHDDTIGCHHVRLFHYIPHHQWPRVCGLLPILPHVQVPLHVGQRSTSFERDGGTLLP